MDSDTEQIKKTDKLEQIFVWNDLLEKAENKKTRIITDFDESEECELIEVWPLEGYAFLFKTNDALIKTESGKIYYLDGDKLKGIKLSPGKKLTITLRKKFIVKKEILAIEEI